MLYLVAFVFLALAMAGGYYAFAGGDGRSARVTAIAKPQAAGRAARHPIPRPSSARTSRRC